MGKLFLIGIVFGLIYGAYGIYGEVTKLSSPPSTVSEKSPGQDSAPLIKTPPVPTSEHDLAGSDTNEPLPVLSSSSDFIQVEAWGIVEAGGELPDGSVLRSWSQGEAIVMTAGGKHERKRFRRPQEVLALLAPMVSSVASSSSAAFGPWGGSESNDHLKGN